MEKRFCDVAALWVAHSYLLDCFMVTPRCGIRSPVKRCGKSTLLDVFRCLVYKPLPTSSVTASVTFRVIEKYRPCLLIDEADMLLGSKDDSKDLYSVLNDGHRRGGQTLRNVGDDHEPRAFNTYAAVAIASIGKLLDTLTDRCVIIDLKRRKRDEPIKPFRLDRADHLTNLARQLMRWTIDHAERIAAIDPDMPSNVYNRDADNWRPLLAIADIAGKEWPKKASEAAIAACGAGDDDEGSYIELLLGDIDDLFAKREENKVEPADEIPSAALVETLVAIEGHPWAEMGRNAKPLTQNRLARMLKPVGVAPGPIGPKTDRVRGYVLKAFTEAFDRYLPGKGASRLSTRPECDEQGTSELFQSVHPTPGGQFEKCEKSSNDGLVDGCAVGKGESGEREQSPLKSGGEPEPGLPQATIRRWAEWYKDAAADQLHETGDTDRQALNAELRRRLIEEEGVFPEYVEAEFRRIEDEVFRV